MLIECVCPYVAGSLDVSNVQVVTITYQYNNIINVKYLENGTRRATLTIGSRTCCIQRCHCQLPLTQISWHAIIRR